MVVHHPYEEELLAKIKRGDRDAFKIVYDQYHHVLFRNVIRLLHSEEDARDVVQEVFMILWEKRSTLTGNRSVNGWLFTVSYNRTVNFLKKKLRSESTELAAGGAIDDKNSQDDLLLLDAQLTLVEEAVSKLSPRKREVFELCRLQGKTYEAAARELGISKYTVSEYLQEAMAFIRDYVRNQPPYKGTLAILAIELFFR